MGHVTHRVTTLVPHYRDVIMNTMASQITNLEIVYSTVYSGAYQRKHQSSASLAFVRGIHRWPVNSSHKWPVTRKMFPFDDVIMNSCINISAWMHDCLLEWLKFTYRYIDISVVTSYLNILNQGWYYSTFQHLLLSTFKHIWSQFIPSAFNSVQHVKVLKLLHKCVLKCLCLALFQSVFF